MANLNHLFGQFQEEIALSSSKKSRMITSRDALRERIRKYFKDNHPEYLPKFFIQGSYKMGSAIRTKDDICDLDDGIYFFRSPDVSATTLQGWVWDAVNGYTATAPEHRKKCIRKVFAGDYEIDFPVYYKIDGQHYRIAVKNEGWEDSDPKAVVKWFNSKKDMAGMLIRIVRDLKAWCDYKRNKMPSGLAMTVLATNALDRIVVNTREDITLADILSEIQKTLKTDFRCTVPAVPFDNLFENYSPERRQNFMDHLDAFLQDARAALRETNELKASKLYRKHLGERFPLGEDKNESSSANAALIAGIGSAKPYADA
ncbi:CBASS cGAMP synthase [Pedobacter sp.]|uniref:CBASS cGAMP synthase n=1 Tax=Pedobacter sp. TaxID=1411316 RepID=UPI003C416324